MRELVEKLAKFEYLSALHVCFWRVHLETKKCVLELTRASFVSFVLVTSVGLLFQHYWSAAQLQVQPNTRPMAIRLNIMKQA